MKVVIERIFNGHVDLTADTVEHLHEFAKSAKLGKRSQFRNIKYRPHYRIENHSDYVKCIKKGAMLVTPPQFMRWMDIWHTPEELNKIVLR